MRDSPRIPVQLSLFDHRIDAPMIEPKALRAGGDRF
jgi:hypothetical protein